MGNARGGTKTGSGQLLYPINEGNQVGILGKVTLPEVGRMNLRYKSETTRGKGKKRTVQMRDDKTFSKVGTHVDGAG